MTKLDELMESGLMFKVSVAHQHEILWNIKVIIIDHLKPLSSVRSHLFLNALKSGGFQIHSTPNYIHGQNKREVTIEGETLTLALNRMKSSQVVHCF